MELLDRADRCLLKLGQLGLSAITGVYNQDYIQRRTRLGHESDFLRDAILRDLEFSFRQVSHISSVAGARDYRNSNHIRIDGWAFDFLTFDRRSRGLSK